MLLSPLILAVAIVGALVLPVAWLSGRVRDGRLRRRFAARWSAEGKVGVLVYSNSPNWGEYIEARWLPHLADRMVVLNWSERQGWPRTAPLEARIHARWAGRGDYNPVAIVFPPSGDVEVVRFRKPFRDWKHGRPAALTAAEKRLASLAGVPDLTGRDR